MIGMDFLGPIKPQCSTGARYVLMVIDYFSRFVRAWATEGVGGEDVEFFFEHIFAPVFGWPANIYSDNRPHFTAGNVVGMWSRYGVHCCAAPVYHPKSVGMIERAVQLVASILRKGCHALPGRLARWSEVLREENNHDEILRCEQIPFIFSRSLTNTGDRLPSHSLQTNSKASTEESNITNQILQKS